MAISPDVVLRESFGRREFLRRGAGALLLALGSVLPGCRAGEVRDEGGPFSDSERQILRAICNRLLPGGAGAPAAIKLDVAGTIERLLRELGPHATSDFRSLLAVFEWSPLLFQAKPRRFTRLAPQDQDQVIRGWAISRIGFRRTGFVAIKRVAMSTYYAQEGSWAAIGFPGPWLLS